jgi:hypothetical protein
MFAWLDGDKYYKNSECGTGKDSLFHSLSILKAMWSSGKKQ